MSVESVQNALCQTYRTADLVSAWLLWAKDHLWSHSTLKCRHRPFVRITIWTCTWLIIVSLFFFRIISVPQHPCHCMCTCGGCSQRGEFGVTARLLPLPHKPVLPHCTLPTSFITFFHPFLSPSCLNKPGLSNFQLPSTKKGKGKQ